MQKLGRFPAAPALEHPCFSDRAHSQFARIHLPVAPKCNIRCAYCDHRSDCPNESRPGLASRVIQPEEALQWVERALLQDPRLRVAGIAGPGEPLANPQTFRTLEMLHTRFPFLTLCLSTNGLALPPFLPRLVEIGVDTLTVTINTLRLSTARQIYREIRTQDTACSLSERCSALLSNQQEGVKMAAEQGITVKINMVVIPGINDDQTAEVAAFAAAAGASVINLMPLIPQADLRRLTAPSPQQMAALRHEAAAFLPQLSHCRQCRADAYGIPGEES